MDDAVVMGRPFGGCGIIFRRSLADRVDILPCTSKRFCALLLNTGSLVVLCVCVYFPTNYHDVQSSEAFIGVLGELEGLIDSVAFDHLIMGGDFNVDLDLSTCRSTQFSDFLHERGLVCADRLPISSIRHTYFCDANGASSWIDQATLSKSKFSSSTCRSRFYLYVTFLTLHHIIALHHNNQDSLITRELHYLWYLMVRE